MDVLELIGRLNDLVHEAKHVPPSSEVRVDKEELPDLLDQMRATIPEELKEARWIVKERDEMLASAEREAERILGEARERQTQLVVEHHLAGEAELASEDIIDHARAEEREIRLARNLPGTLRDAPRGHSRPHRRDCRAPSAAATRRPPSSPKGVPMT